MLAILTAVPFCASAYSETAELERRFARPGFSSYLLPGKTQYTIILEDKGWGSTVKVMRSGDRIREETTRHGKTEIVIADLGTGLSFKFTYLPDGRYGELFILPPAANESWTMRRTGETDSHLGHSCSVWEIPHGTTGIVERDCLTPEGVPLWQRILSSLGEIRAAETTSVSLAPVKEETVTLPADLLQVRSWGDWSRTTEGPNTEVRLQSASQDDAPASTLHIKRLGPYGMSAFRDQDYGGETYIGEDVSISVTRTHGGQLQMVSVNRSADELFGKGEPVVPARIRNILGEDCTDYDMARNVADYTQTDCKTEDGILLERESTSWGKPRATLTATFVRRDKLTIEDVAPPSDVLTNLRSRN